MQVDWRIWYGDGSSYSNLDGSAYDAPADSVMVICTRDETPNTNNVGRLVVASRDFYWWDEVKQTWFGGDVFGMYDYLRQPGHKKVCFGRFVRNEEYQRCLKLAIADPDLPVKSARHPEEVY